MAFKKAPDVESPAVGPSHRSCPTCKQPVQVRFQNPTNQVSNTLVFSDHTMNDHRTPCSASGTRVS